MSHHLDTPLAAQSGQLFITDLYVFDGEHGTVFVMNVNSSITGADIKPGFHHEARYEFKVHVDGGEDEELTYRVTFDEPDPEGRQALQVYALTGSEARDDLATGTLVLEGRTGETVGDQRLRVWAGRIRDPFYIDLDQLAAINKAFKHGTRLDRSAWHPENPRNSFADATVESIVLEVGGQDSMLRDGMQVGVWCATKLATDAGGWWQINRAGHPMMWPIFWPTDTDFSNPANVRHPRDDAKGAGDEIASIVARVIDANGTSADPAACGRSVARQLLPDVLSYRIGSRAIFGFAERNGRQIRDNAPEVMFSLVMNTGITTGFDADVALEARSESFPYVVAA
ncbi:DUF4331 family protein [Micromonospora sp. HM5-17]|uniref:DUF4331 family protein n=1 Tax=Micromonospora sp. HM5-17 TaxID=2487710 RepID=UPI000F4AD63E|nr:DUF4331 family protein [Micromonospora sp. HM5-17]ROT31277.1 DUF4331 domain-containing protein [Micromonospora sp. HM5-17]